MCLGLNKLNYEVNFSISARVTRLKQVGQVWESDTFHCSILDDQCLYRAVEGLLHEVLLIMMLLHITEPVT